MLNRLIVYVQLKGCKIVEFIKTVISHFFGANSELRKRARSFFFSSSEIYRFQGLADPAIQLFMEPYWSCNLVVGPEPLLVTFEAIKYFQKLARKTNKDYSKEYPL